MISDSRKLFTREFTCLTSTPNFITALHPSLLNQEAEQPPYSKAVLIERTSSPGYKTTQGQGSKEGCPHTRGAPAPCPYEKDQWDHSAGSCRANECMGDRNCQWNLGHRKKKPKLLTGHTEKGPNFIHSLPKKLMMLFLEVNNQL